MESFREQRCRACLGLFHVCPCCDHGQVYCGIDCKKVARKTQVRDAKRKYLADEDVREGERQRQRDHRARVRDHGSQIVAPSASVPIDATRTPMTGGGDRDEGNKHANQESPPVGPPWPTEPVGAPRPTEPEPVGPLHSTSPIGPSPPTGPEPVGAVQPARAEVRCAFCGRRAQFVRFGPLRRWRTPRWQIRGRAP
jgi:hypothetical protein